MNIIAIFGLVLSVICVVLVFQQLYLCKREFKRLDDDQVISVELAKRLYRVIGLVI